jgi:hypothetical protein
MRIDTSQHWPRLLFTETGLAVLRTMMRDTSLGQVEASQLHLNPPIR